MVAVGTSSAQSPARLSVTTSNADAGTVEISGNWTVETGSPGTDGLLSAIAEQSGLRHVGFDTSALIHWDSSFVTAILRLVDECPDKALPMLVLDELDKANQGHHATDRALLGVLEPRTAARFRDEFLNVEIDVRPMAFMATANALPRSSPLTSRFQVVKVAAPTQDQTPMVVRSVERALRRDRPELNACFSELSEDIVQALARLTPRQVRIVLEGAYSRAALRHIDSRKALGGDQGKVPLIQDDFGEAIRVPATVRKTPQLMPIYVGLEFVGWRVQ